MPLKIKDILPPLFNNWWYRDWLDWHKENVITKLGSAITKETKQIVKIVIVSSRTAFSIASGEISAQQQQLLNFLLWEGKKERREMRQCLCGVAYEFSSRLEGKPPKSIGTNQNDITNMQFKVLQNFSSNKSLNSRELGS